MNVARRILLSILILSIPTVAQKKDTANYGARINCPTCVCEEIVLPLRGMQDATMHPLKAGDRVLDLSCSQGNGRVGCKGTIKLVQEVNGAPFYLVQRDPQIAHDAMLRSGIGKEIGIGLDSLCSSRPAMSGQCPCENPAERCDCSSAGSEFIGNERVLWLLKASEARAAQVK